MAGTNRFQKYVQAGGEGAPTVANANRFSQYQKPEEPKPEAKDLGDHIVGNIHSGLANFNDTMTFGLYDKFLEATGIDPNAEEKLAADTEDYPWAAVAGDTAGYVLPGLGASHAVGKAVPALAGNAWKSLVGREALASGGLSATDDLVRTGTIDPTGVAIDTAAGGLLSAGFAGAGRLISPEARIRASGNDMTDPDRVMTEYYMRQGEGLGVPLSIPEAAQAANAVNAPKVQGLFDDALQTPQGAQAVQSFEAGRAPKIAQAGRGVIAKVGPGATPDVVTAASDAAILRAKTAASDASQPLYDKAATRKIAPSHIPNSDPGFPEAVRSVTDNVTKMRRLQRDWEALGGTGPIPQNSTLFLDAVKKQADDMASANYSGSRPDGLLASTYGETSETIRKKVDRLNPTYATARETAQQGAEGVSVLQQGPLGRVAKQPTAKGQASTIFGVDNAVDEAASRRALALMGAENPAVPAGLLANNLDSAISSNPGNWANTALPTEQSRRLAMDIAPPDVVPTIEAAQRVDPFTGQALPHYDSNPIGKVLAAITSVGKGKVAKGLLDPDNVKKLGKTGPVQRTATQIGVGATKAAQEQRKLEAERRRRPYQR